MATTKNLFQIQISSMTHYTTTRLLDLHTPSHTSAQCSLALNLHNQIVRCVMTNIDTSSYMDKLYVQPAELFSFNSGIKKKNLCTCSFIQNRFKHDVRQKKKKNNYWISHIVGSVWRLKEEGGDVDDSREIRLLIRNRGMKNMAKNTLSSCSISMHWNTH